MNEYRADIVKKTSKKVAGMIDVVDLILDAEIRHIDEYSACEELCVRLSEAKKFLTKSVCELTLAIAAAEMEDVQDSMQQSMDQISA